MKKSVLHISKKLQIPATCERITETHARKLRTPANVSRHFGNSLAKAVRNLSPTGAAQRDRGLTLKAFKVFKREWIFLIIRKTRDATYIAYRALILHMMMKQISEICGEIAIVYSVTTDQMLEE